MYTGSKRFNQNQSFLKTRHVHTESSKLRNNEAFTIQKSTSCTLLEAKYGSRNKNPESYAPGGNHATHLNYQKMTMEMSGVF